VQRGRPRHDDLLTPREWEVLDLLREGRSNDEIADRLGISVNGAKYHVSEIITKLGVRSRREAAEQLVQPRSSGFALHVRLAGILVRGFAIVMLLAAGVGFALLAVGVAVDRMGGRQAGLAPTPQPTEQAARPSPTSAPSSTPTPVVAPVGVPIPVWVYADTVPASNDCQELIGDMIPATAGGNVQGKAVDCVLDMPYRLKLHQGAGGFYHLEYINLLLLLTGDFPTPMPGAPPAENTVRLRNQPLFTGGEATVRGHAHRAVCGCTAGSR